MEASFDITGEVQLKSLIDSHANATDSNVIDTGVVRGLKWKWVWFNDTALMTTTSEKVFSTYLQLTWNQEEMKFPDGFKGNVRFTLTGPNISETIKDVPFEVGFSGEWFGERCLKTVNVEVNPNQQQHNQYQYYQNQPQYKLKFKLSCKAFYSKPTEDFVMRNFVQSEATDAVLSVEGKMLYVNKSFLSFHSKYFLKVFSGKLKEQNSPVIEIKDVGLDEFTRLLCLIYPDPVEPTVENVERYLKLADMFLLPAATRQLEKFLQSSTRVKDIQKIVLADKHGLENLLKSTLSSVNSYAEVQKLTRVPEFAKLGNDTKAAFMVRFMHFL